MDVVVVGRCDSVSVTDVGKLFQTSDPQMEKVYLPSCVLVQWTHAALL